MARIIRWPDLLDELWIALSANMLLLRVVAGRPTRCEQL